MYAQSLRYIRLFVTPWTVAYHAPPSMGFSSQSTEVGCHFLFQRIFPTQGSNLGLPNCRQTLYHLSHQGRLKKILQMCFFFFLVLKPGNEQMCFMVYNMVKLFVEVYLRLHFEKQFASTFE